MKTWEGKIGSESFRVGIIVSRWNARVTEKLLQGALDALKQVDIGEDQIEIVKIPGCFEMPLAAQQMARRGGLDAMVCLGAVIQGETTHHEHIGAQAAAGIREVSQAFHLPIGFGILTTKDTQQALERSGGKVGNKGSEAVLAALEMASLIKSFKKEAL